MSCTDCTVILLYCKVVMNLDVYNCGLYQSLFYTICSVIIGHLICTVSMLHHMLVFHLLCLIIYVVKICVNFNNLKYFDSLLMRTCHIIYNIYLINIVSVVVVH